MQETSETDYVQRPKEFVPHPVHKKQESRAILLLLFFSFLMVTLPFGAFFSTKYILIDYNVNGFSNVIWSVSAAVITVNLIIAVYAYIAYKEKEYDLEGRLIEDKPKSE